MSTVLAIGVSLVLTALAPVPSARAAGPQIFRQSFANSFIVYGKRRVGGLIVFFHAKQGDTGAHWRYFVIAVAGHRCKGVVDWMLNDQVVSVDSNGMVTSGPYANNAWLYFQRGSSAETANSVFVAECDGRWTTNHKGNGVAAIYARFKLTDDVVDAGMPNITAVIEGKDTINDTRGPGGYTRNGALIFYDWLMMPREEGGFGAYPDELPDASWISAQANVCDEVVDGEPRYALDCVIATGAAPNEVRDALVLNMAGTHAYSGGKYLMRPGYWVPPSVTLSEDDLAGPVQVSAFFPADTAANEVQGTFVNADDNYQGAPFETQRLTPEPADTRQMDVDLAFTTSSKQAARVARIMLNRAQHETSVVWPMNLAGLGVRAMDAVQLASTKYSLDNYAWIVGNWSLTADWGSVVSLREESPDIYDEPTLSSPSAAPALSTSPPIRTTSEIQGILQGVYLVGDVDAIDAGSSATIRIHGATATDNFTLQYPITVIGALSVTPKSITGKSYSTLYYPYCDVDPVTLLPVTWGATTVYLDSLNSASNPYRISFGRSVTTPAAGGSTSSGGSTGGGYGGGGATSGGGRTLPTP